VAAAGVAALVAAPFATAALWVVYRPAAARPGATVEARTGGRGAVQPGFAPIPVFLAPADATGEIRSPRDSRLVRIGALRIDDAGNGRFRFTVPDLPPGRYSTFLLCRECARFSAGRTFLPGDARPGAFRVLASPDDAGAGGRGAWRTPLAVLAVALAAAAAFLAAGRLRLGRRGPEAGAG
jgi:hypothetical protein